MVGRARAAPGRYIAGVGADTGSDRRSRRPRTACALALALLVPALVGACTSPAATATTSTTRVVASGVEGRRYCEVLLVHLGPSGLYADVYNTYPLNDCPPGRWAALDASSIAKENGALVAELNGPRYWLMNSIAKERSGSEVVRSFGGIAMIEEATVDIGTSIAAGEAPYTPHTVNRQAAFTFGAGRQVYELVAPDGSTWVMQTWSQIKDPTLSAADLPGLASRLTLPDGWTYRVRTLTRPLVVATESHAAHVLQDDLEDSYSLEAGSR